MAVDRIPQANKIGLPTPGSFLKEAIKAVPAVKYALGVGGIAAVVAIIAGFHLDYRVAVFGTVIVFALMFVLLVFARSVGMAGSISAGRCCWEPGLSCCF